MSRDPYGTATFCDDIRHEITGKYTLVGCYQNVIKFDTPSPAVLSHLGVLINLRIPGIQVVNNIHVELIKEESGNKIILATIDRDFSENETLEVSAKMKELTDEDTMLSASIPILHGAIEFKGKALLRVRATVNKGPEIKLGTIAVEFSTQEETDSEEQ